MVKYFIQLELKRFYSILSELGVFRALALLCGLFVFSWALFKMILFQPSPTLVSAVLSSTILSLHIARKDKRFLKIANINRYILYSIEYSLLQLFFIVLIFYKGFWIHGILLIAFPFLVSSLNLTIKTWKRGLVNLYIIPPLAFEWKENIRKRWIVILIVYVISLALSQYLVAILASIIVLGFIVSTFYFHCEPWIILHTIECNGRKYVNKKILGSIGLFLTLIAPQIIIVGIFYFNSLHFLIAALWVSTIQITSAIVLKYALYVPGVNLKNNYIILSLLILCYTYPFLMPIPLLFSIIYYRKAIRRLNNYLYDFN